MMKRKQVLIAALCVLIALAAVGCSKKAEVGSGASKGKLTIFMGGLDTLVTSFETKDNTFTQRLVKETGIDLDITGSASSDFPDKFNIMVSTGDYPDVIMIGQPNSFSRNDLDFYGRQQHIFQELDEKTLRSYPNINKVLNDHADIIIKLKSSDGKFYALPDVNDCAHCTTSYGRAYYYMPWLRDNNIKAPETIDEFTNLLRFIRDNDVNGNGNKNDEIPLITNSIQNFFAYLAKPFLPWVMYGNTHGVAVRDGKIWEQYRDPAFREALKYMRSLYKEGLIAENSFTVTRDQIQALVEGKEDILGVLLVQWHSNIVRGGNPKFPLWWHAYPLEGPTGERWGSNGNPDNILNARFVITDKCKDPALALQLYDHMLGFEQTLEGYSGAKGTFWTDPDPGALSLGGGTPKYKLLIPFGSQPVNTSWDQNNPMNRTLEFRLSEQADDVDTVYKFFETGDQALLPKMLENKAFNELQWIYFDITRAKPWAIPNSYFLPRFAMNEEDGNRVSDIQAVLVDYKQKAWVEFVVGTRDINNDAHWNTYLQELERMGSRDLVALWEKYL
ncbi:hypothetical protein FACS1894109_18910 [Spirochaetia bacterium]|nr:hypothetical protein FACS1894109_18910 [Spirochaetia bacterium]